MMRHNYSQRRGLLVLGAVMLIAATPAITTADDPDNCLFCHQYRGLGRFNLAQDEFHLYYVTPEYVRAHRGAHSQVACTGCHERSEVAVIPHQPTSKVTCTKQCHLSSPAGLARRFSHANVADTLEQSVHSSELLSSLEFSNGPLLGDGQSHCLYCHDEPVFRDIADLLPFIGPAGERSVDRCNTCHGSQIPVDVAYYLLHVTSRIQHSRPPLEMAQVCAVCHSDPKIKEQFGMLDATGRYSSSFHGKAALLGSYNTADCVSCHVKHGENSHVIRSQTNPISSTYPDHKADSCRATACHPGADLAIGAASVHFDYPTLTGIEIVLAVGFVVLTLLTFGPSLVLTVLELLQVVIGRHVHGEQRMRNLTLAVLEHPEGRRRLRRFTPMQNVQHWILVALFASLVLTGFPMKFADRTWARVVIESIGGLSVARTVHHWGGIALVVGFSAHAVYVAFAALRRTRARRPDGGRVGLIHGMLSLPLFIGPADLKKAGHLLAYLLFLRKTPPTFSRFTIDQKFEYIGVAWGTLLLGVTGALLWGEQIASHYFSGRAFNIAIIAHTYEAFLAVIHVGILHIANVVLSPNVFPLSRATLTGQTPITRLAEAHTELVEEVARDLGIETPGEVSHA